MKNKLKSLLIPVIVSGVWGVFSYVVISLVSTEVYFAQSLFYPFLFGGITVIIACVSECKIALTKALVAGLVSGFIYVLLSPIFPLLSSILAGASLGGGLSAEERLKNVFDGIISILKGVISFPIFIYAGDIFGSLFNVFDSHFLFWFFWGAWISLGISFICMPLLNVVESEEDFESLSEAGEFKSEAQEILRELNELEGKYK